MIRQTTPKAEKSSSATPAGRATPHSEKVFKAGSLSSNAMNAGNGDVTHAVQQMHGQPLDAKTKGFMESGFGQDFCHVRVHTDSAASSLASREGAEAFASGNHLVFAAGRYRPETAQGAMLLAHELAHVVQQRDALPGADVESPGMEHDADSAAASVMSLRRAQVRPQRFAPAVQFLKVTSGALGKALEVYTDIWKVPDRAINLLQASPRFMKIARAIDAAYVWRGDSYKNDPAPAYGPDGKLAAGPFKGKRELFDVINGPAEFEPMEAPAEPGRVKLTGDLIQLQGTDTPQFIQELAHEVTHVANFIGAAAPPPATLIDSIDASIKDEVAARKSEAKIVGEVPSKAVNARIAGVGTRVPAEVERDISPAFGLTYFENAFFGFRLHETQTAENLTDEEAEALRNEVEKAVAAKQNAIFVMQPHAGANGLVNLSEYADTWFDRRTAQIEWKELFDRFAPASPPKNEMESLLQDHARRFFGGKASYSSLAAPTGTGGTP
jgi:hypothetical protein